MLELNEQNKRGDDIMNKSEMQMELDSICI